MEVLCLSCKIGCWAQQCGGVAVAVGGRMGGKEGTSSLSSAYPTLRAPCRHRPALPQYLEKGGRFGRPQSAKKGCNDPIRCVGGWLARVGGWGPGRRAGPCSLCCCGARLRPPSPNWLWQGSKGAWAGVEQNALRHPGALPAGCASTVAVAHTCPAAGAMADRVLSLFRGRSACLHSQARDARVKIRKRLGRETCIG